MFDGPPQFPGTAPVNRQLVPLEEYLHPPAVVSILAALNEVKPSPRPPEPQELVAPVAQESPPGLTDASARADAVEAQVAGIAALLGSVAEEVARQATVQTNALAGLVLSAPQAAPTLTDPTLAGPVVEDPQVDEVPAESEAAAEVKSEAWTRDEQHKDRGAWWQRSAQSRYKDKHPNGRRGASGWHNELQKVIFLMPNWR